MIAHLAKGLMLLTVFNGNKVYADGLVGNSLHSVRLVKRLLHMHIFNGLLLELL